MSDRSSKVVQVIPPVLSDKPAWMTLWAQYNAFYGRDGDTALSREVVDTTWRRLLDPANPVGGLVAVSEGTLVGLGRVEIQDAVPVWSD